jgi:type IV pilus assembly protein PilY1
VLSAASAPPTWDTNEIPYPEWDAGQKIKAQASTASDSRTILTRSSTSGTSVDFAYANLSSTQQASLNLNVASQQDNCGPERVDFLRGHSAREGTGSLACATAPATATPAITQQRFRTRSISILGDIINSNPSFVGPPSAGYSDVDHPGYSAFRTSFKNRAPVVYVGANDGMLHGFDVSTSWQDSDPLVDSDSDGNLTNDNDVTVPAANAGNEVLAYVPSPVYPNLNLLTDENYKSTHRYFVDSSPMMADVCVSACTSAVSAVWKTVLIGGLGAGGKGFYALNVTNPLDSSKDTDNTPLFATTNATKKGNILMWEFTNADDTTDLGFTFNTSPTKLSNGQAKQIVKFENGRWGVVVGNGYNSSSGKAALYVLFVEGPTGGTTPKTWQAGGVDYVKIVAENGPNNGLSTPVPFDADGDGLVDTVYAGDLQGNLWKFDLSSATASSWAVAYSGAALFSAGTSQPITTPPEVSLHPTSGTMVLIGTGKYLGSGDTDPVNFTTQAFYGLHDNNVSVVSSISNLIEQDIVTTTISGKTFRKTAPTCDNLPLDITLPDCPSPARGWYTELPTSGERVTGSPKLDNGLIVFNTFIPSVSPCDFGGTGWLMALNYLTGTTPTSKVFDTNSDGKIDSADTAVSGLQVGAALGGSTLIKSAPGGTTSVAVSSLTTGKTASDLFSFGAGSVGRINWREILQ